MLRGVISGIFRPLPGCWLDSSFPIPSTLLSGVFFAVTAARQAQSTERRFVRGLFLTTIPRTAIYQAVLRQAFSTWGDASITLALDTTRLFQRWCLVCVSLTYRGRALPLAWQLLEHPSSVVSMEDIHPVLASVHSFLSHLPEVEEVYFRADRGFMDQKLMALVSAYGWKWAIRGKGQVLVYDAQGKALGKVREQLSQHGQQIFLNDVYITADKHGPVSLAAYHAPGAREPWFVVSNHPCGPGIFDEYAERFQIEAGFKDLKSAGFDLEASHFRDTTALSGLIFLLALAAVFLFSEGTSLESQEERRTVDAHKERRLSYFQLGRRAILSRLARRFPILQILSIPGWSDPDPVKSTRAPPGLTPVTASLMTFIRP